MWLKIIKGMFCVMSLLMSWHVYAIDDELKENCLKAWNNSTVIRISRDDYQQFGKKYCHCAALASFNSREELAKMAETCMSDTLMRVMIDTLRQQDSSEKMTNTLLNNHCEDTLKIIYPQMNKNQMMAITNYCHCVVPELVKSDIETLNKKQLKAIANQCAPLVTQL